MHPLVELARTHDLAIVSDCAHAIEARYRGRPVSEHADISAFSFYATKNLTTAEGGMVTTDRDDWAEEIRIRRLHGLSRDAWRRYSSDSFCPYETVYPGYKYNLTDLQASLGIHQLSRIESNWTIRDRHTRTYRQGLADVRGVHVPDDAGLDASDRHARHLFFVLLDLEELTITRDQFAQALHRENIGSGVHFTPLHLHPYYRSSFGHSFGDLPKAERAGARVLSLPLSAKLTDDDVDDVIRAVRKVATKARRPIRAR